MTFDFTSQALLTANEKVIRPYNDSLTNSRLQTVPLSGLPHANYVYSLALTSNPFRIMCTGDSIGGVYIWDAFASINGDQLMSRQSKMGLVDTITRNGVLLGSFESFENPQDQKDPSPVSGLDVHSEGLWCLAGTAKGKINMHSVRLKPGAYIHTFAGHVDTVSDIKISDSQTSAVSGDSKGKLNVWDLNTGKVKNVFTCLSSQITHIEFQPINKSKKKDNIFLAMSQDGNFSIFDSRQQKPAKEITTTPDTPPWGLSAYFSDNGSKILVGRRDTSIEEYEKGVLAKKYKLPFNSGPVAHAKYLPNGHAICASIDNIRIANLPEYDAIMSTSHKNEEFQTPFEIQSSHHGGPISRLAIDNNHEFLCTSLGLRDWAVDMFSSGVSTTFQLSSKAKKPLDTSTGHVNCLLYQIRIK